MSTEINAKVKHLLRARQTRSHTCHWIGCTEQVPPAMWGCRRHWFKLPKAIRDRIWLSYRIGQEEDMRPSREYLSAAIEAENWIKENGHAD